MYDAGCVGGGMECVGGGMEWWTESARDTLMCSSGKDKMPVYKFLTEKFFINMYIFDKFNKNL